MNRNRNFCLKCGGSALRDFAPMCEHEHVPEPRLVRADTDSVGELMWYACGFFEDTVDAQIVLTEHPLRAEAVAEWKRQWLVLWAIERAHAIARLAREAEPREPIGTVIGVESQHVSGSYNAVKAHADLLGWAEKAAGIR